MKEKRKKQLRETPFLDFLVSRPRPILDTIRELFLTYQQMFKTARVYYQSLEKKAKKERRLSYVA